MRSLSTLPRRLVLTVLALPLLSCGGASGTGPTDPDTPEPASVTITPSITTLDAEGASAQFTAKVRDDLGREMTGFSVSWLSTDPTVATISSSGLATALQNGTTIIIAAVTDDVSGWATLNVDLVELLITSGALEPAVLGQFYSQTLVADGASNPTWSITAGALPDGLTFDGSTGVISGTPTTRGVATFTVTLESGTKSTSRAFTMTVIDGALGTGFGEDQFTLVQPVSFQMGSENGRTDEQPVHDVNITEPFYIQKTEVTQAQWVEILGTNPSGFGSCGSTCPVDRVSWDMIQDFLVALNAKYPGQNFRMPTEAEWELAARAGTTTDFGGSGDPGAMGWYAGNAPSHPMPVALKEANDWGLFDMHGNVEEWVWDYYSATYYGESPTDDPQGPVSGSERVLRGGSFGTSVDRIRSAARSSGRPNNRGFTVYYGFRLARDGGS